MELKNIETFSASEGRVWQKRKKQEFLTFNTFFSSGYTPYIYQIVLVFKTDLLDTFLRLE